MHDLIVIGGGSAGLTATAAARKLGARVLLVEAHALGGDCLWTGCVPSKTLIRSALAAHELRHADRFGLPATEPRIDGAQVFARVRAVMQHIAEHDDSVERYRQLGADVRLGRARFVAPDTIDVDGEKLGARAFLVATGSRPAMPDVPGLAEAAPLTSENVFQLDAIPRSLAVVGGGPIGCELGQAFARLGARVTIIQRGDRLLEREDPEVSSLLQRLLEREGVVVHTGAKLERVERTSDGARLHVTRAGAPVVVEAERVLVSAGRRANVDELGLRAAGIDHDQRRIVVDDELRTTNPRVFAAGDVAGHYLFTHVAGYEAVVAVRNALLPFASKLDERVVPWCTFTDPEVARVGMTEAQANAAHRDVEVYRADYADVDRAHTDGETAGFVKIVTARGRVVGVHLIGARAGDIIHTGVLAVKEQLKVSSLASMTWIYPTLSEVIRKASQSKYEKLLERGTIKTAVGILRRFKGHH